MRAPSHRLPLEASSTRQDINMRKAIVLCQQIFDVYLYTRQRGETYCEESYRCANRAQDSPKNRGRAVSANRENNGARSCRVS